MPRHFRSSFVLTNPKTGTRYFDLRDSFNRAKEKAGINPALRWHDLRHTGASRLAMAGVLSRAIMTLMNIKSESARRHQNKQASSGYLLGCRLFY